MGAFGLFRLMKVTLGELRSMIKSAIAGSHPSEAYSRDLVDDPAMDKDTKYVSKKRKKKISKFLKDMGLAGQSA